MKFSILVLPSILVSVAKADCSNRLVNGVNPQDANGPFKDKFFYPRNREDQLFRELGNIINGDETTVVFQDTGVKISDKSRDYQARDNRLDPFGEKLNITKFYAGEEATFTSLCEEIWACR